MPESVIKHKTEYSKNNADLITNFFSPLRFKLEIDSGNFGVDISATFAAGKNKKTVKKKLAKQDFDFLYDQKKGGLYFNENGAGKGFGEGGIIAILKGAPDLTASNLEFIWDCKSRYYQDKAILVIHLPQLAQHFTHEMDCLWDIAELGITQRLQRKFDCQKIRYWDGVGGDWADKVKQNGEINITALL